MNYFKKYLKYKKKYLELLNKTYEGGAIMEGIEEVEKDIEESIEEDNKNVNTEGGRLSNANKIMGCETDEDCADEKLPKVCIDKKCTLKEQKAGDFNINDYFSETF